MLAEIKLDDSVKVEVVAKLQNIFKTNYSKR